MKIRTASQLMRATIAGDAESETGEFFDNLDHELTGFSIDTRTVEAGQLFFALSPEDYRRHYFTATSFDDAHRYIPGAFERGAAAVVARRARVEGDAALQAYGDRLLLVDDCIAALQAVAHGALKAWGGKVVAITGSAGKTTAKDLTAHILTSAGRRVLKTQKNFNNELGLALSILQMETAGARPADYDVAVLELGQSMFGEIGRLAEIASPDIAVELNVAPVHLEFFESIEQIAEGKAQLIENLKPEGTAVLNADDARVARMRDQHDGRTLTFGIEHAADVSATEIEHARFGLTRFRLRTPLGEARAAVPLPGRHNLLNALAAAAVATCFEIAPEQIAESLATASASERRGELIEFAEGFSVIDDSYNSNPRSLLSMARSVVEGIGTDEGGRQQRRRRTIIVAGEMLELGETGAQLHREAGREIAEMGVQMLWGVRGLASELVAGGRAAGMNADGARFFETTEEAAAALLEAVREGDLWLVKGSRGVHMERIIEALRERYQLATRDDGREA